MSRSSDSPVAKGGGAILPRGMSSADTATTANSASWTSVDAAAQAEALRTIAMIGERRSRDGEDVKELQAKIQELDALVVQERYRNAAKQNQMVCLEHELEEKDAKLMMVSSELQRRESDLRKTESDLRSAQDQAGGFDIKSMQGLQEMKRLIEELKRQLKLKDEQIFQLMSVLHEQRRLEDSTMVGTEHSTTSSFATMGSRSTPA